MERIDMIPSGSYEGYWWMSDSAQPIVAEKGDSSVADRINVFLSDSTANPFVIEGQLYDAVARRSVSIKYVDGQYIVHSFEVTEDIDGVDDRKYDHIVLKRYAANRMPGKKLRFLQYWRETPDSFCCGMPVLTPAEKVFIGFEPLNKMKDDKSTL